MRIEDADLEIGDIVSGRDYITGILVQKPVVRKILVIRGERMKVEYKLKGEIDYGIGNRIWRESAYYA